MGCGNCGSGTSGKPAGCKSNGGCSSGGCNRLNVFDWLSTLPLHDSAKPYPIIEVSFNKGSRKDFFRNNTTLIPEKGQMITVEGTNGFDVGMVNLTGELVKLQMKKYGVKDNTDIKRIMRLSTEEDLRLHKQHKEREQEIMVRSRAMARQLKLEMKVCEVEIQADGKKATFFYTADGRVDFRELIKIYATEFRMKVEMRQIGARQESAKVGGLGSCGRELCCSTWLTDFKSVNTAAARYQNLSINQAKLSGQCGRLKCCLNYELDTYMDALRGFPDHAEHLETAKGTAYLQKRDIFRNLMWYSFRESNKQYPLSIVQVQEILDMNKNGIKPEELRPVELETKTEKSSVLSDMGFVNDVGQLSLKSLDRSKHKKKQKQGGSNKGQSRQASGNKTQDTARGGNTQARSQDRQQGKGRPQDGRPPKQGNQPQQENRDKKSSRQSQAKPKPRQEGSPGQGNPKPRPPRPPKPPTPPAE